MTFVKRGDTTRVVTLPRKSTILPATLKSIMRQAGWTVEDLHRLL